MEEKDFGAIRVGKSRFFWMAYRFSVLCRWLAENNWQYDASEVSGLDGEGFAKTMEEALTAARSVADQLPGPMRERYGHLNAKGNAFIRELYRERYGRKPPVSSQTDAQPPLGSLWESSFDSNGDHCWKEWRITRITKKRIFVGGNRQRCFDRAILEDKGNVRSFYTAAGRYERGDGRKGTAFLFPFPLLGLQAPASREDVMAAFRQRAKTAHPDAGGDAEVFRALVAEKDRALMTSCS